MSQNKNGLNQCIPVIISGHSKLNAGAYSLSPISAVEVQFQCLTHGVVYPFAHRWLGYPPK